MFCLPKTAWPPTSMKAFATRQCTSTEIPSATAVTEVKCLTLLVFEQAGKTILQPLVTNQEAKKVQELFQKNTLEVWLSNGQPDLSQFDVAILKYKQQMQPLTKCGRTKNRMCLKNHFETIVSCEQCPLSNDGAED